jgi:hypothetical protein
LVGLCGKRERKTLLQHNFSGRKMKSRFQRQVPVFSGARASAGQAVSTENRANAWQRGLKQLIALFCVLELLDALVTFWAVRGGLVWEGNSLIAPIAGTWGYVLIKLAGAVLSGVTILILSKHFRKLSMAAAVSIVVFYGVVLAWNSSMIIRLILSR